MEFDSDTVIVVASPNELKLLNEYVQIPTGKFTLIVSGIGYGNVYSTLKDIPTDCKIINVGYAGSNKIPKGTVCKIGESRNYHPNVTFEERIYTLAEGNTICYSSADFVTSTEVETPCVFDMELYAIMSMGFTNVSAIKVVSDSLNYKEYENTLRN